MAKGSVRIKKSKHLRFQLISLLYLVFLSISAIQIPDEWVRITRQFNKYFSFANETQTTDVVMAGYSGRLEDIESNFKQYLGMGDNPGEMIEPKGYSKTDNFFLNEGHGKEIHYLLWELDSLVHSDENEKGQQAQYDRLFAEDIRHGLRNKHNNLWLQWKFEHVPATIALSLLEEMKLRINLIGGSYAPAKEVAESQRLLKVAYNIDEILLGDTLVLSVENARDVKAVARHAGGRETALRKYHGDSLLFIAPQTGQYQISLQTEEREEILDVQVKAAEFLNGKGGNLKEFYQGEEVSLSFVRFSKPLKVKCQCSEQVKIEDTEISFTAAEAGWCELRFLSQDGRTMLHDSVYIREIPTPLLSIDGASHAQISIDRLQSSGALELKAFHPAWPQEYKITKVNYRTIGAQTESHTAASARLSIGREKIHTLQYVVIDSVEVKSPYKTFTLQQPMILRIAQS